MDNDNLPQTSDSGGLDPFMLLVVLAIFLVVIGFPISHFFVQDDSHTAVDTDTVNQSTEDSVVTPSSPHLVTAYDGSSVLVIPDSTGFSFFEDDDADGFAETQGRGSYDRDGVAHVYHQDSLVAPVSMDSLASAHLLSRR